jgi:hypothetical protein
VPYVPNHERIELGLQGYGSDVPQDVLDEARARHQQIQDDHKTLEEAKAPRKRARNAKGHLVADDPTTPEKNEAWEDG